MILANIYTEIKVWVDAYYAPSPDSIRLIFKKHFQTQRLSYVQLSVSAVQLRNHCGAERDNFTDKTFWEPLLFSTVLSNDPKKD
jgi:hypothetical protein